MGILVSSGQVFDDKMDDCGFFGELSLDGSLNKTDGILPMVMAMRKAGVRNVIVPKANREEASLVHGIRIYPAENLEEIIENFNLQVRIHEISDPECLSGTGKRGNAMDFADVKGQETAKRADYSSCSRRSWYSDDRKSLIGKNDAFGTYSDDHAGYDL